MEAHEKGSTTRSGSLERVPDGDANVWRQCELFTILFANNRSTNGHVLIFVHSEQGTLILCTSLKKMWIIRKSDKRLEMYMLHHLMNITNWLWIRAVTCVLEYC